MEGLLIGGLQGLMNYAGISVFDKLKLKKLQRKISDGTATATECLKAISILQNEKDSFMKIRTCCEQLIRNNNHLTMAYVYLGMLNLHQLFNSGSMSSDRILASEGYRMAKECLEKAHLTVKDDTPKNFKGLQAIKAVDDFYTHSQIIGMLNYYHGFIYHLEGDEERAQSCKKLGQELNNNMKAVLPY
jgi:hypothetical protein